MTVKLYFFAALLGLAATLHAQTTPSSKVLHRSEDLFGNQTMSLGILHAGPSLSVNYDIRFGPNQLGWGIHAGIGYTLGTTDSYYVRSKDSLRKDYTREISYPNKVIVPVGVSYVMGKPRRPHRLEFGLGVTYMSNDAELFDQETTRYTWLLVSKVAYRRYYFNKRFTWSVAFTPLISLNGDGAQPLPWFECGVGIRL